jgi:hypothetical protein
MSRPIKNKKERSTYAIIGEGRTEHVYFSQLKQYEQLEFTLKPALPQHSSAKSIVAKALELLEKEYDHIFCVFDMDEINRDSAARLEYQRLKHKYENKHITFIENNPSIEYWFLLHFKKTHRLFATYKQLEKELRAHISDYEKTEKYLTRKEIYRHLKPGQSKAKQRAATTLHLDEGQHSRSEMHILLNQLKI